MGLTIYGDRRHLMNNVTGVHIPEKIIAKGDKMRAEMLNDFGIEIGTSFGPLHGKIWRIGTMGYVCRKANILRCLGALEAVLRRNGYTAAAGAGVDAAWKVYDADKGALA
jgi:(S)-ureidoglycine-glyoxylate aminotransferase